MVIHILIVDDHTLLRQGTRELLTQSSDLLVVGEVARGDLVLDAIETLHPEVVLLDVRLPGLNGIDVTRQIVDRFPGVRVIILTAYDDENYVSGAVSAGASGYLLKTAPASQLAGAIRAVQAGATVFDAAVTGRLVNHRGPTSASGNTLELSAREREVLQLVCKGMPNKAIAVNLGISRRTVEGHLHRMFEKVAVGSRTELMRHAIDHHLLASSQTHDAVP